MSTKQFIIYGIFALSLSALSENAFSATVEGQITDSDKKPIGHATVSVGDKFDFTDVDGKYRIKDVSEGNQKIIIRKESEVLKEIDEEVKGANVQKNYEVKN